MSNKREEIFNNESVNRKINEYRKTFTDEKGRVFSFVALVYNTKRNVIVEEEIDAYTKDNRFIGKATSFVNTRRKCRRLRIGYSIKHVEDEYNEEYGFNLARERAIKRPFCDLTSDFCGEFTEDTVMSLIESKFRYLKEHK